MQPLTAAMPFKAEGAPHLGGCQSAVWTVGGSQSALCPSFFPSKKPLRAGGDQRERSTGGAGAAGSPAGFCPHLMEAVCRSFASHHLTEATPEGRRLNFLHFTAPILTEIHL